MTTTFKVAEDDITFKLAICFKSLSLNDNTGFCSIIQTSKLVFGSLLAKSNFFVQFWTKNVASSRMANCRSGLPAEWPFCSQNAIEASDSLLPGGLWVKHLITHTLCSLAYSDIAWCKLFLILTMKGLYLGIFAYKTPYSILNKIETHSLHGFSQFAKRFFIDQCPTHCSEINCYVCCCIVTLFIILATIVIPSCISAFFFWKIEWYIDGLVWDCRGFIANALELLWSCSGPSIYYCSIPLEYDAYGYRTHLGRPMPGLLSFLGFLQHNNISNCPLISYLSIMVTIPLL